MVPVSLLTKMGIICSQETVRNVQSGIMGTSSDVGESSFKGFHDETLTVRGNTHTEVVDSGWTEVRSAEQQYEMTC